MLLEPHSEASAEAQEITLWGPANCAPYPAVMNPGWYWRSPDTGRMYPQEPAYDVLGRVEEVKRSQVEKAQVEKEGET